MFLIVKWSFIMHVVGINLFYYHWYDYNHVGPDLDMKYYYILCGK
jgi:hypothetical protein